MSKSIFLVTGNPNKLAEIQAVLPADIRLEIAALDLPEIQSLDPEELIGDKLRRAYVALQAPVIVEDTWAELESLHGLPGPFIKHFEKRLGDDALYKLARAKDERAVIRCYIGYYDGAAQHVVVGELRGTVVAPRGTNGWGFDKVFMPEGHNRTMGEMTAAEKNKDSHRTRAIRALAKKLASL